MADKTISFDAEFFPLHRRLIHSIRLECLEPCSADAKMIKAIDRLSGKKTLTEKIVKKKKSFKLTNV